jgi:peptide/nickel transport system permease protein
LRGYVVRRVLSVIPVLFLITLITFVILRVIPGNPVLLYVGGFADPELIKSVTKLLGLDQPLWVQYWKYLSGLLQGDLGNSFYTGQAVTHDLRQRFPATLELTVLSMIVSAVIAIPLGILSALRRDSLIDHFGRLISTLGVSMPEFWLGVILIQVFFVQLHIAPAPVGRIDTSVAPPATITGLYLVDSALTLNWTAFSSALSHLVLPVLTLGFIFAAPILRQTRSAMLTALNSEAVAIARANGIPRTRVITRYAFRMGFAPIITMFGLLFGYLLGGDVLVEVVFAWPGLGQYAVLAIQHQDYSAVQGVVLLITVVIVFVYLLVDLLYAAVDPRITYDR